MTLHIPTYNKHQPDGAPVSGKSACGWSVQCSCGWKRRINGVKAEADTLFREHQQRPPIAVLGGAFDPITIGHLRIAELVAKQGFRVLFMPCGDTHSFGKKMLPAQERLRMANLAAPGQVTDAEIAADSPYAEDTYKILRETYGDVRWIIGSDNANKLHLWHHGDQLKREIPFIVVIRPGYPLNADGAWCRQKPHQTFTLHNAEEISSTAVRQAIGDGNIPKAASLLSPQVLNLIQTHGWYRSEKRSLAGASRVPVCS